MRGGEIICLSGELGTGKTVFVKGLASGLGIRETITSPTFILVKEYPILKKAHHLGPLSFVHIDLYRLDKIRDLKELGLEEYLGNRNKICVIEWAEKINHLLKGLKKTIWVKLKYLEENKREIEIRNDSLH